MLQHDYCYRADTKLFYIYAKGFVNFNKEELDNFIEEFPLENKYNNQLKKIYTYQYIVGDDRYVYFSRIKKNDNYEAIGFINEDGEELRGLWMPMFYGTEITQDSVVKIMSLATGKPSQNRDTDTQKTYILE